MRPRWHCVGKLLDYADIQEKTHGADLVSELVMQPVKSAGPQRSERLAAYHEALDRLQDVLLTTPPPPGSKLEACSEDLTRRLLTGLSRLDPEAGRVAATQCKDIYTTRVDVLAGFGPFSGRPQVASEIRARQLKPGLAAYRAACDF